MSLPWLGFPLRCFPAATFSCARTVAESPAVVVCVLVLTLSVMLVLMIVRADVPTRSVLVMQNVASQI